MALLPDHQQTVWTFEDYDGLHFGRGAVLCAGDAVVWIGLPRAEGWPDSAGMAFAVRAGCAPVLRRGGAAALAADRLGRHFRHGHCPGQLPFRLIGVSSFFQSVLMACHAIPRGHTASYADLAAAAGSPGATRAVGSAMARNPIPLVIPCHRIVRRGGDVGRYGGGMEMKRWLLEREGAL